MPLFSNLVYRPMVPSKAGSAFPSEARHPGGPAGAPLCEAGVPKTSASEGRAPAGAVASALASGAGAPNSSSSFGRSWAAAGRERASSRKAEAVRVEVAVTIGVEDGGGYRLFASSQALVNMLGVRGRRSTCLMTTMVELAFSISS